MKSTSQSAHPTLYNRAADATVKSSAHQKERRTNHASRPTHDPEGHVVCKVDVVSAVDGDCTVPGLADSAAPHVLLVLCVAMQVPVQRVPAQLEGLPRAAHLDLRGKCKKAAAQWMGESIAGSKGTREAATCSNQALVVIGCAHTGCAEGEAH
eukprot:1155759-Pelagomonas_calceolata.AAC.5